MVEKKFSMWHSHGIRAASYPSTEIPMVSIYEINRNSCINCDKHSLLLWFLLKKNHPMSVGLIISATLDVAIIFYLIHGTHT